jgi:hypothetical protein
LCTSLFQETNRVSTRGNTHNPTKTKQNKNVHILRQTISASYA